MPRYTDYELLRAVGARIRELRETPGLTQQELAERIGIGQFTYSRYETGRRSAPLSVLARVAQALDVAMPAVFEAASPVEETDDDASEEWRWLWTALDERGREIVLDTARSALRERGGRPQKE